MEIMSIIIAAIAAIATIIGVIVQHVSGINKDRTKDKPPTIVNKPKEDNLFDIVCLVKISQNIVLDIRSINYTFNEKRRLLSSLIKVLKTLKSHMELLKESDLKAKLILFSNILSSYISEADYILPYPNEDKITRKSEIMKKLKYDAYDMSDKLINEMLLNPNRKSRFLKLSENCDFIWEQIGYESYQTFLNYLSPHFKDIIKTDEQMLPILLKKISNKMSFSEAELLDEGFTNYLTTEILNALMRDELVVKNNEVFTLTSVGKSIIDNSPIIKGR